MGPSFFLGSLTLVLVVGCTQPAAGQAWVPPAGEGSITIATQRIDHSGHRVTNGSLPGKLKGKSRNVAFYVEAEYAITDRLSASIGLPYVFGRYTDPDPPPPFVPFLPVDQCRCWNSGWQDFAAKARYNLFSGAFALTPSISVGLPSHDYEFQGEAVLGRNLKEWQFGVAAGQRLDWISPRLSVQGRYAYAVVERVLDIPNNRSNATLEGAFLLTRRLSARGLLLWQRTHGGLRFGNPPPSDFPARGEVNTTERLAQHDRLLRDNSFHAGGAMSYRLPAIDVFASYIAFLSGTDTHAGYALTAGVSWPFEVGRRHKVP